MLVITKGDANNAPDEEISISTIEGKVIYNGGILNFLIDYKFGIISLFLALYLFSCYYGSGDKTKKEEIDKINDIVFVRKRLRKRIRPEYRVK